MWVPYNVVRRLVIPVAAGLVVAALAAGSGTATRAADASPGSTLRAFVEAAGKGDAARMWGLLSKQTQRRYGPDLARFRKGTAVELTEGVGSFARSGSFRVGLSDTLSDSWAIAVVTGRRQVEGQSEDGAYGAALRGDGAAWRLELGGPVRLRILGPHPGEVVTYVGPQTAVEAKAPTAIEGAILYGDGTPIDARSGGTSSRFVTFFGNATGVKAKGVHFAAALAVTATEGSAVAWAFRLSPKR